MLTQIRLANFAKLYKLAYDYKEIHHKVIELLRVYSRKQLLLF